MTVTRQTKFRGSKKIIGAQMAADSAIDKYPSDYGCSTSIFSIPTVKQPLQPFLKKKPKVKKNTPTEEKKEKQLKKKQQPPPSRKTPPVIKKKSHSPRMPFAERGNINLFLAGFLQNFNKLNLTPGMKEYLCCCFPANEKAFLNREIATLQQKVYSTQKLAVRFTVAEVQQNIITKVLIQVTDGSELSK